MNALYQDLTVMIIFQLRVWTEFGEGGGGGEEVKEQNSCKSPHIAIVLCNMIYSTMSYMKFENTIIVCYDYCVMFLL